MAVISDLWRAGIETDIVQAKGLSREALLAEVRVAAWQAVTGYRRKRASAALRSVEVEAIAS
jgi:hypothetical protein